VSNGDCVTRRFNPPPNWPLPPEGWRPPPGWKPDPAWPPAPPGWELWIDDGWTTPNKIVLLRVGAGVMWLLLLVSGAASGGVSGFLVMVGSPLFVIGVAAVLRGAARWAWLTSRPAGGVVTTIGIIVLVTGGALAPSSPVESTAGSHTSGTTTLSVTETTVAITTTATTVTTPSSVAEPPTSAPPVSNPIPAPPPAPRVTTTAPQPLKSSPPASPAAHCDAAYPTVCIPSPPPALNCSDIPYRRFTVLAPDPHGFDRDHDGVGCESG
jgi:hypothetical protein